MSEANQQPDPGRHQTRPANAHAHPSIAAKEALAVRRKKEDIEREKQVKNERRRVREKKKADAKKAVIDIAEFENDMAVDDMYEEKKFPRHQSEGLKSGL